MGYWEGLSKRILLNFRAISILKISLPSLITADSKNVQFVGSIFKRNGRKSTFSVCVKHKRSEMTASQWTGPGSVSGVQ